MDRRISIGRTERKHSSDPSNFKDNQTPYAALIFITMEVAADLYRFIPEIMTMCEMRPETIKSSHVVRKLAKDHHFFDSVVDNAEDSGHKGCKHVYIDYAW